MSRRYVFGVPNAICDICGFRFQLTDLRKNWKHQMVCRDDFETRNAQEFVRGVPDRMGIRPDMRPRPADVFVGVNDVQPEDL